MSVGRNIRQIRKNKNVSQSELGRKVDLSASQISNIESGRKQTTYDKIVQISEALSCHVSDLYDDADKIQQENAWVLFGREMEKKGVTPEEAEKWIKLARQIINEKD